MVASRFSYWFAVLFSFLYPAFLAVDWHWGLYYPLEGQWRWSLDDAMHGPAMQWYGLIAAAGIAAVMMASALAVFKRSEGVALKAVSLIPWLGACWTVWLLAPFFGL